jgi:hypothetical protein
LVTESCGELHQINHKAAKAEVLLEPATSRSARDYLSLDSPVMPEGPWLHIPAPQRPTPCSSQLSAAVCNEIGKAEAMRLRHFNWQFRGNGGR